MKFFTTILAGIAIGILIAPDKGSATRRKIADFCSDLTDDLDDLINAGKKNDFDNHAGETPKIMGEF